MELDGLKLLTPGDLVPALNPTHVVDGAGLDKVKSYFRRLAEQAAKPEFAKDYETNVVETFYDRRARTLQVGDKNEQYVIDFLPFAGSKEALIAGQGNFGKSMPRWLRAIVDTVQPAFESDAFLKVGQNLAFEYEVSSWCMGMRPWNYYSIDIAERVIVAGKHSFKDLRYFSLAAMAARYFGVAIDKTHQTSFDLETPLVEEQIVYACLDLRLPLAVRGKQLPILRNDDLERVTVIENDAVGFFMDMHLNGWNIDRASWVTLIEEWSAKYYESIKHLDTYFVPVVGPKHLDETNLEPILDEWKSQTFDSAEEVALKQQIKETKDKAGKDVLRAQMALVTKERKERAAEARKRYMAMRSRITESKRIVESCEGEAAINYGSNAQLVAALRKMKGFNADNLPSTDDSVLKKLKHKPVIEHLRDYRTYAKMLETYGKQWVTEYHDKPGAENGWVNPGTGKIHSTVNQLEAETGRTSSVKPNSQNLPADKRVRSCFIADDPNPEVQVSVCCDEPVFKDVNHNDVCPKCSQVCETKPEEYVIVTCDMSGAELRIIAEESGSEQWITALNNQWDLHSCGTETLYPEEWPAADQSGQEETNKYGVLVTLPPCAYFNKGYVKELGREEDHQKCQCPKHLELRDRNKATNFLLAYGGGPDALAEAIGKTSAEASVLMEKHEKANPEVWAYLEASGKEASKKLESRSRSGRRRLFDPPNWDKARDLARERMFESLKKKGKLSLSNGEKLKLEDMNPQNWQIKSALRGMYGSIERRGKNFKIQELNATIAKRAAGAGRDANGKPYLFHLLKTVEGRIKGFIHDEFVAQFPTRFGEAGLTIIKDAIKRAGAEFLTKVSMESEGRVAKCWQK